MTLRSFLANRGRGEIRDAVYLHSKREWNDRIREKDRYIKYAWCIAIGALCISAICVIGIIYLGTLPKRDVEYVLLDPLGYSVKLYSRDLLTSSEREAVRRTLLENFIKNLRETHPYDKKKMERALMAAAAMVLPNSEAFKICVEFFRATQPYKRATKEAVTVDVAEINKVGDNTYHVAFDETVTNLTSKFSITTHWTGVITTETKTDVNSKKRAPLGFFIKAFDFQEAPKGTS